MCMTQECLFKCFINGMNIAQFMKNLEMRCKILSIKVITSFLQDKNLSLKNGNGNSNINLISMDFFIETFYYCIVVQMPPFLTIFTSSLHFSIISHYLFVFYLLFKYSQFHYIIIIFLECTPFFCPYHFP
jgi:hypothetical protein